MLYPHVDQLDPVFRSHLGGLFKNFPGDFVPAHLDIDVLSLDLLAFRLHQGAVRVSDDLDQVLLGDKISDRCVYYVVEPGLRAKLVADRLVEF